jgi:glycerol uptake facilitator protein
VREFFGETIGTFLLVFFGCGSVAVTVLFSSHVGMFQIAAVWVLGVTLAIYATRHLFCAHLNPGVSIAMVKADACLSKSFLSIWGHNFSGLF